jgi:tRNA nucleotidyltransferase (CCA-adding enzyme)
LADLVQVCEEVKHRVTPPPQLRAEVHAKAEEIRTAVERESKKAGLKTEVRVDGSVAKDTWLRDYADVDIFMRVSPDLSKAQLRDVCLPIAKRALAPNKIIERFADHPYVESIVRLERRGKGLRVNVVPCYDVKPGQWLSATDRSPYHTEYIRQHLTVPQRDEVRLLKAFMRGIGAYGADIKTGGFSGMLCETVIASQQDFVAVLNKFSNWEEANYLDLENYFQGRSRDVHSVFREPLIVIDPVDKGRNLAAAVRREQLWNFVAACRRLLAKPTISFFAEPRIRPLTAAAYRRLLTGRGSTILALVMGRMDVVVDILWSQLYRTERAVVNLLENNDFSVIRSRSWSDEHSLNVILIELEQSVLAGSKRHGGPPVSRFAESKAFLEKHAAAKDTLSGPWIEGDRWVVLKERNRTSATALLKASLKSGGRNVGVASEPARTFERKVEILSGPSIGRLVAKSPEFGMVLKRFLSGRPVWLE